MKSTLVSALLLTGASAVAVKSTAKRQSGTTLIPNTCFDDYTSLEEYFAYLYPWGSDHNGSARMVGNSTDHDYVAIDPAGQLTITAQPVTGQPANGDIAINYLSGAVHAKQSFAVEAGGGLDFSASFIAPVDQGTWPAFWLTATEGWPPEIDLAEWKGSGKISFNTFNTSSEVDALDIDYPSPTEWHDIKAELRDENGSDVSTKFYLDGELVTTQVGKGYTGAGFYLIINLQMEGSSGSPGPTTNTTYAVKNLEVTSYNP
ncbi:putative glycoside hydrolase family 16 protein [Neofusicoccum parvum UCRNP2]|uniref:Fungal specific transcription factor domain-containing protein n=2 Tax=Neofusicoccum parvum TaxID=310453 RepID=A0ACB5SMF6_9PEZI|nr:putative glycoside hydrolase family 16 protein [Neofusicoccum parvum UCRNP2]GME46881.1 fungal specific transcription factor domain-containing protein [Neofusicoccum parvum]